MTNKYTLDRIEKDQYVFLKRPDETEELLVPMQKVHQDLKEGDIVEIIPATETEKMKIMVLHEETQDMKEKVSNLLEKLKNKK